MPATPSVARRHNIPTESTSFVGRVQELTDLRRLLSAHRLITITGPGGCGKTRLAGHLAAGVVGRYRDGVWLVELASITDAALVPRAVADILGVQGSADYPIIDALAFALSGRQLLLVLDNCEHVSDACALLVDSLLRTSESVCVLATSREPLRVSGEVTRVLQALRVPEPVYHSQLAELAENEAVRLFLDRTRAHRPEFTLSLENAAAIADICRRVDGIPLAIELAAGLVPSFSVAELAGLLEHTLPVLVHGRRTTPRQATLRAAINWSYVLLGEQERVLFRRLAVFLGRWDYAALAGICAAAAGELSGLDSSTLPGVFAALVEKSMVLASDTGGTTRYRLLEPVRQFALELLIEHGEIEALRRAHARYFTALAEAAAPSLLSAAREPVLNMLAPNMDNFRAALGWTMPTGGEATTAEQAELALRLAPSLFGYWHFRGPRVEGFRWIETSVRGLGARDDRVAAVALHTAGEFAFLLGDYDLARERLEVSIRLWRSLNDSRGLAYAVQALAPLAEGERRWELAREAGLLFAQAGDAWGAAVVQFDLGFIAQQDGDDVTAHRYMDAAVAQFLALGDRWFAAQVLIDQGDIERSAAQLAAAASRYASALGLLEQCSDTILLPSVLYNQGIVARERGQTRAALQYLRQALVHFRDRADLRGVAECLIGIGGVLGVMQQSERAVRLFGAAEALLAASNAKLWTANLGTYARDRDAMRERLEEDAFVRAWTAGRSLAPAQVVQEVLSHQAERSVPIDAEEALAQRIDQLTPREREVATLVAHGYTNRQIAAELVISTGTAGLHVKHILHKLGYTSRAQVAAWAVSAGVWAAPGHNES